MVMISGLGFSCGSSEPGQVSGTGAERSTSALRAVTKYKGMDSVQSAFSYTFKIQRKSTSLIATNTWTERVAVNVVQHIYMIHCSIINLKLGFLLY